MNENGDENVAFFLVFSRRQLTVRAGSMSRNSVYCLLAKIEGGTAMSLGGLRDGEITSRCFCLEPVREGQAGEYTVYQFKIVELDSCIVCNTI